MTILLRMAQNTIEVLKVLFPKKALINGKSSEYKKTRSFEFEDIENNSVFDDSGLILASIHLAIACSEVLNISQVTHTPICNAQNENLLLLGTITA